MGKTTLMKTLAGHLTPVNGQIRWCDQLLVGKSADQRARNGIAYVPQGRDSFAQLPVEENLQTAFSALPRQQRRIDPEVFALFPVLQQMRKRRGGDLSGGQQQQLAIARALLLKPSLLILDEPTAGVDIELRRSMWTFLEEINRQGTTIILTTHYLEEAEALCRNIAIIDHGKILKHTSKKALLQQLSVETFVLDTEKSLDSAPELNGFPTRLDAEGALEVEVEKGQGLNQVFVELERLGIKVVSMRTKANRL